MVPIGVNNMLRGLTVFFLVIIVNIHFSFIIFLYYKQKQIHKKEIILSLEKQEFERKFTKKKIFPHYFFNIMEYLYVKSINNEKDLVILDKLKFVLYYFLVDAEKDKVELEKELVFYKYYADLENIRRKIGVPVTINVVGKTDDYMIIPLLFEPLISNAIKYSKQDGTGIVNITFDTTNYPVLNFQCSNNCARNPQNVVSSENGLKIFEERLNLCYNNKYSLKVIQEDDVYKIFLSINVE